MHEILFLIVPDGAWGVVAYWNAAFGVPRWAGLRGLGAVANVASKLGCRGGQGCGLGVPRRTWLWYEPFLPLVANKAAEIAVAWIASQAGRIEAGCTCGSFCVGRHFSPLMNSRYI